MIKQLKSLEISIDEDKQFNTYSKEEKNKNSQEENKETMNENKSEAEKVDRSYDRAPQEEIT